VWFTAAQMHRNTDASTTPTGTTMITGDATQEPRFGL